MKTKFTLGWLSFMLLFHACNNEIIEQPKIDSATEVSFTSSIGDSPVSRASNSKWDTNDQIGVYMLNSKDKAELANNVCYVTSRGDGNFYIKGASLYYPEDGSGVDFLAYYPYRQNVQADIVKIDISDQSKPEAIDLLYSKNLTNRTNTSPKGSLQFYHQLARLIVNFTTSDNSDLSNIKAVLKGVATQGDFSLKTGILTPAAQKGSIDMKREGNSAEALLIPAENVNGIQLTLSVNGKSQTVALPKEITALESGARYTFAINIKNSGSSVNPVKPTYRHWMETPVISQEMLAKDNIMYINHDMPKDKKQRNYSLLYDSDLKMAYWVAYPYCSYYDNKDQDRTDAWQFDPSIPQNLQVNLKNSYDNYDRGHQIPSADRLKDYETNASTFYYTNITPQVGKKMNQTIWADLESKVRSFATGTDTLYIVTGASVTTPTDKNIKYISKSGMQVAVPKYYFKALARKIQGQFHTIAFKLENRDYSHRNYWEGVMSVSELEEYTGFTFFPNLDNSVKAEKDRKYWD